MGGGVGVDFCESGGDCCLTELCMASGFLLLLLVLLLLLLLLLMLLKQLLVCELPEGTERWM